MSAGGKRDGINDGPPPGPSSNYESPQIVAFQVRHLSLVAFLELLDAWKEHGWKVRRVLKHPAALVFYFER